MRLFPQEVDFFVLFEAQSRTVLEGAELLHDLVNHYENVEEKVRRLKEIEHHGDEQTHEIIDRLNRTFVTPLDREDIHALASGLDDILDAVEGVGSRLLLFNIQAPTPPTRLLADVIRQAAGVIVDAMRDLRKLDRLHARIVKIKTLENEADHISRNAVAEIFNHAGPEGVLELIKWKEIYGRMESAADRCEDIANVVEGIVVKNA
jgi:predicted phosphate transport protein (TIGR00153 family)